MSGNRQAMSMLHEQLVGANQQIEKELTVHEDSVI